MTKADHAAEWARNTPEAFATEGEAFNAYKVSAKAAGLKPWARATFKRHAEKNRWILVAAPVAVDPVKIPIVAEARLEIPAGALALVTGFARADLIRAEPPKPNRGRKRVRKGNRYVYVPVAD